MAQNKAVFSSERIAMARARNIKPSLFKNEILGQADPIYTLLFQSLWLLADREGRLEDRPMRIKAETFPYRDGLNIDAMLSWLHENGFIVRYSSRENPNDSRENRYIQVVNFFKHQNPHKNEAESTIPCFSNGCTTSEKIGTTSEKIGSAPADSLNLIPDSLSSDSGLLSSASAPAPAEPADAYLERVTQHENARTPVTMTATWQPSESFPDKLKMAGVNPDKLTGELLAKFRIHHDGESKPQNKWESALVTWCKRERTEPENKAAAPEKQSTGPVYKELKMGPPKVANDPNDPEWIARQAKYWSYLK